MTLTNILLSSYLLFCILFKKDKLRKYIVIPILQAVIIVPINNIE